MVRTIVTVGIAAAAAATVAYYLPDLKRYIEMSKM